MRLLPLLALAAAATAEYISEGWSPGQKVETEAPAPTYTPQSTPAADAPPAKSTGFSLGSLFDLNKVLTSGPAVALFSKAGINITERVAHAESIKLWDERIPLITDHNYHDLIVNEPLTPQEEEDRVWLILITISSSSREEAVSKMFDKTFDAAFDKSMTEGDLPNVKWGRINYLNVTTITTKWSVWRAPSLVVLRRRGRSLRFYSPYAIRINEEALRNFLLNEGWRSTPRWSTSFAPGGDNEYIMDFLAEWMTKVYNVFVVVPNWLLLTGSTMLASFLISFLHRGSSKEDSKAKKPIAAPAAVQKKPSTSAPSSAPAPAPAPAAASTSSAPAAAEAGPSKKKKKLAANVPTPGATDSEQESVTGSPAKRSSARQRRAKKA